MYYRVGLTEKDGYKEPSPDWMKDAYDLLTAAEMFASEEVGAAANKLLEATSVLDDATVGVGMRFEDALEDFRKAAQLDLGLAVTTLGKTRYAE